MTTAIHNGTTTRKCLKTGLIMFSKSKSCTHTTLGGGSVHSMISCSHKQEHPCTITETEGILSN